VNNTDAFRDKETGRFLAGNGGNGGRKRGSRSKLGEQFLEDLQALWAEEGKLVLQRAAQDNPVAMVKVVANLLPRELLIKAFTTKADISIFAEVDLSDAAEFNAAYQLASQVLGIEEVLDIEDQPQVVDVTPEVEALSED
jgi:hypothetical protein